MRSGGGTGQALEEALIDHGNVGVEPRQPQGCARAIHEGCDPAQLAQALQRPFVDDQALAPHRNSPCRTGCPSARRMRSGCSSCAQRARPSCPAPWHRRCTDRRVVEALVHGHHDRVEAAEQGRQREQVGQDINALAAAAGCRPARRQEGPRSSGSAAGMCSTPVRRVHSTGRHHEPGRRARRHAKYGKGQRKDHPVEDTSAGLTPSIHRVPRTLRNQWPAPMIPSCGECPGAGWQRCPPAGPARTLPRLTPPMSFLCMYRALGAHGSAAGPWAQPVPVSRAVRMLATLLFGVMAVQPCADGTSGPWRDRTFLDPGSGFPTSRCAQRTAGPSSCDTRSRPGTTSTASDLPLKPWPAGVRLADAGLPARQGEVRRDLPEGCRDLPRQPGSSRVPVEAAPPALQDSS